MRGRREGLRRRKCEGEGCDRRETLRRKWESKGLGWERRESEGVGCERGEGFRRKEVGMRVGRVNEEEGMNGRRGVRRVDAKLREDFGGWEEGYG